MPASRTDSSSRIPRLPGGLVSVPWRMRAAWRQSHRMRDFWYFHFEVWERENQAVLPNPGYRLVCWLQLGRASHRTRVWFLKARSSTGSPGCASRRAAHRPVRWGSHPVTHNDPGIGPSEVISVVTATCLRQVELDVGLACSHRISQRPRWTALDHGNNLRSHAGMIHRRDQLFYVHHSVTAETHVRTGKSSCLTTIFTPPG